MIDFIRVISEYDAPFALLALIASLCPSSSMTVP